MLFHGSSWWKGWASCFIFPSIMLGFPVKDFFSLCIPNAPWSCLEILRDQTFANKFYLLPMLRYSTFSVFDSKIRVHCFSSCDYCMNFEVVESKTALWAYWNDGNFKKELGDECWSHALFLSRHKMSPIYSLSPDFAIFMIYSCLSFAISGAFLFLRVWSEEHQTSRGRKDP